MNVTLLLAIPSSPSHPIHPPPVHIPPQTLSPRFSTRYRHIPRHPGRVQLNLVVWPQSWPLVAPNPIQLTSPAITLFCPFPLPPSTSHISLSHHALRDTALLFLYLHHLPSTLQSWSYDNVPFAVAVSQRRSISNVMNVLVSHPFSPPVQSYPTS